MKFIKTVFVVILSFFAFGCATTISYKTKKPSKFDLKGAQTIYIDSILVPDSFFVLNNDDVKIANYIENQLANEIEEEQFFNVYTSRDRRSSGDVYFDGEITKFIVEDRTKESKRDNPNYKPVQPGERRVEKRGGNSVNTTDKYLYEYKYYRSVRIEFKYEIKDSNTGKKLAYGSYDYERSSSYYDSKRDLPSAFSVIASSVDDIVDDIVYAIHPHIVYANVTLLESDVKILEKAEDIADDGNLQTSYNMYKEYYDSTGDFVAGYNAALLQEAMGYLFQAKYEMEQIYSIFGDKRALEALNQIESEIDDNKAYDKQIK